MSQGVPQRNAVRGRASGATVRLGLFLIYSAIETGHFDTYREQFCIRSGIRIHARLRCGE